MTEYLNDTHGGDAAAVAAALGMESPPKVALDFSVNVNPRGMPPLVDSALAAADGRLFGDYPELYAAGASQTLAAAHGVEPRTILVGNGSTETFAWIVQTFQPGFAAGIAPCYSGYADVCRALGVPWRFAATAAWEDAFRPDLGKIDLETVPMLFLCSPNNPSGALLDKMEILELAARFPRTVFVVDESFIDFLSDPVAASLIGEILPDNLVVVKSLTKFFTLAGLRLGFCHASPATAARLAGRRLPWSVNGPAQAAARLLYLDKRYLDESRGANRSARTELAALLRGVRGIEVFEGAANFLLCRLEEGGSAAPELQRRLLAGHGMLIRSCANTAGLGPRHFRLAVRLPEENRQLAAALAEILGETSAAITAAPGVVHVPPRRTPALMVAGCTSAAGKSLIAAGLCRLFARGGVDVAPFKAQNMSLNSFVTADGGEMGRAQVVQAMAAKIAPRTDMNPVLLKPSGDAGSQLIVDGQPVGNVTAKGYYRDCREVRARAFAAYDRLASRHGMIVLEGAGGAAEINLLERDFVNLAMAEHAGAAVILVADIDPGGVFASLYGSVRLLPPSWRRLIKGFVINKFRGDESLLAPAIDKLRELTGIPVLGVMPYLKDLRIEEEDSLGLDDPRRRARRPEPGEVDIVVPRLPRISNYTDFMPLEGIPGVCLRYPRSAAEFGDPDLVIIPGTKNTRSDLDFLFESGIAAAIRAVAAAGRPVFGICGGFQMLGNTVDDPDGVEGETGVSEGLGLLPIRTVMAKRKELRQVEGRFGGNLQFVKPGTKFRGYEIHMGRSEYVSGADAMPEPMEIAKQDTGAADGGLVAAASADGLVFGSYAHGLFDEPPVRDALLKWLFERKNLPTPSGFSHSLAEERERGFERLADLIEAKIDLAAIGFAPPPKANGH